MSAAAARPKLVHLTTTDMSLDWLLAPQLVAFAAAGYEVVGMSAPGPHVPRLEELGIRHVPVGSLTRSMAPGSDAAAFGELVRTIRAERPDVLHTHNPKPGVLGRIAGRAVGVPVVVNTQHGLYAQRGDRLRRKVPVYTLERLAAACSHAELVQSAEDAATLVDVLRVPARKVTVLGNGIDLSRFDTDRRARAAVRASWGVAGERVVVGVVGRLSREKGIDEIAAALELLRAEGVELELVVVGPVDREARDGLDGEVLGRLEQLGARLVGRRDDMPECYSAMDVFLTATHREGFPRAAMEAAASGLPIVATDVRGCREVVADGETGLLVPARAPRALAGAVHRLAADGAMRERMGEAARELARREFDQQRVIDITLATYERLRSGRAGRG